jgi:hypothetical protein
MLCAHLGVLSASREVSELQVLGNKMTSKIFDSEGDKNEEYRMFQSCVIPAAHLHIYSRQALVLVIANLLCSSTGKYLEVSHVAEYAGFLCYMMMLFQQEFYCFK